MTDEEAMEELLNSDGYSFPTWTLTLGKELYVWKALCDRRSAESLPV